MAMPGFDLQIILVSIILMGTLVLLITEKISVDKTSLGIIATLSLTGILTPAETAAGFANPAVITVGAMFLLSHGLIRTGAVGFVTDLVLKFSKGNKSLAFFLILVTVTFSSAFINDTPVVVLFIPIVMDLGCEYDVSPSKLLIPVSYAALLGGTCSLIGTSTNIIVSDLAASSGHEALSMFELGRIGIPLAIAGILFLFFVSPKLLPGRAAPVCQLAEGKEKRYIAELIVPAKSPLIGIDNIVDHAGTTLGLDVIEIFRNSKILDPARTRTRLKPEDILLVKGSAEDLLSCLKKQVLELAHGEEDLTFGSGIKDDVIVELIVPPLSTLLGDRLLSTDLQDDPDIRIIAVRSRLSHYSYRKIQEVRLQTGDIILIRCPQDKLSKIRNNTDFIVIEDIHHAIVDREKAGHAIAIFIAVVLGATFGLADIMICSLTGILAMTLTGCVRLKDAYRSMQPNVLLLIIGTIALGQAMQKTGTTQLYADFFLGLFKGMGPGMVLFGIILLTSLCSHILSNNATAVLLLPIALSTALSLGVNPKPFIVGICIGASACFASPIGYQTQLLVYGPGGYRFSDYLKLGVPLNILVILAASFFIPVIWPF